MAVIVTFDSGEKARIENHPRFEQALLEIGEPVQKENYFLFGSRKIRLPIPKKKIVVGYKITQQQQQSDENYCLKVVFI